MDHKSLKKALKSFKKTNEDDIYKIEGIATEYGVIDKTDEIIEDGAFDTSIGKTVPIQVMHAGVKSTVGTATITKDGTNLLMEGRLFDNELGKTIAMAKAAGVIYNLSIGGTREEYGWRKIEGHEYDILVTTKGVIKEISITGEDQQAHPSAIVTKTFEEEEKNMKPEDFLKMMEQTIEKMVGKNKPEEFEKMQKDLDELRKTLEGNKELETIQKQHAALLNSMDETLKKMALNTGAEKSNNQEKELETYVKALRETTESADFKKAMTTTDGAVLVPEMLSKLIIKEIAEFAPLYADANVIKIRKGNTVKIPVRKNITPGAKGVAEGTGSGDSKVVFEQISIELGVVQTEIPITDELRQDSEADVVAIIREIAKEDMGEKLAGFILNGSSNAEVKFEGITKNATVAAAALETKAQAVIGADDIIDLEASVKPQYRKGAKYYISTEARAAIKKLKANGEFLWQTSLRDGQPATLNGYPVIECPDMDAVAAGKFPIMFANIKRGYSILEKYKMETEVERDATNRINTNILRTRAGGKVVVPNAIKLLKIKA